MANQEQIPPQQEQPFVAAKQVSFNLEDIILNTNNEVALLYPEHNNQDYFKCVSDFISKCCVRNSFTRSTDMYKEYMSEFWYSAKALENSKFSFLIPTGGIFGEVGVNTFRNAIGAHNLAHSSEYVAPPSIEYKTPKKNLDVLKVHDKNWDLLKVPEKNREALKVRILQITQENGQNRTNMNTRTDRVHKSREFLAIGQNKSTLAKIKAIQEDVKAKRITFKTDKDIVREVIQSTNRGHETGVGRLLPGTSSGSSISQPGGGPSGLLYARRKLIGTSSQYPVPNLYTLQAFSSPGYTPPNLDGYRPTFEHGSTSQIVHGDDLDGDDLDVDGTCDGDGSGSLDGDSDDDSNDACDEEY
ncbi:hypothetical protein Tco_0666575 [Tanacetum coccineum]